MKPFEVYGENIEQSAMEQFYSAMEQDFVVRGALMPDAHTGYSLPIGAVVETDNVVVPAWVGYDIGCGMLAVATSFVRQDIREHSKEIFDEIYKRIPVGFKSNSEPTECILKREDLSELGQDIFDKKGGFRALGTLGGGNHFIEIGEAQDGIIWVVIHSGSRGLGHDIAHEYMKLASGGDKAKEGHYPVSLDSELGKEYMRDQWWLNHFANYSRIEMLTRVVYAVREVCGYGEARGIIGGVINCTHNHAIEGDDHKVIHRKGATQAGKDQWGAIPGNMRDGTYITKGKGNEKSLSSSSHGAGRAMSRTQAKKTLKQRDFEDQMVGITAKVDNRTLDESPHAYKNIDRVMELQKDLVDVINIIKPIINVKG